MRFLAVTTIFLLVVWATFPAAAYIGPGAGLGALGAVIGLLVGVLIAVGVVLLWPIRAALGALRGQATRRRDPDGDSVNGDPD